MLSKPATMLLGLINTQPLNAYEIIKKLQLMHVKDWCEIADSTVYATIKSLEKKSYILGTIQKDGNMPDKTVYTITADGHSELKKTLEAFITTFDYDLVPFMIAVFFIKYFDNITALNLLTKRMDYLKKTNIGIQDQIEILNKQHLPAYIIANVEHNAVIVQAEIISTQKIIDAINLEKDL